MLNFEQELKKYEEGLDIESARNIIAGKGNEVSSTQQNNIDQAVKRYGLAVNYCKTNSYDLAYIQIQKVVRLVPEDVNVQLLAAMIAIHEGKETQAAKAVERVLSLDANNATAKVYKDELSGKVVEAVEKEEKAEKAKEAKKEEAGKETKAKKEEKPAPKKKAQRVVANGSDYEEVTSNKKSFIYLGIGFLIGVVAMFVLVVPTARNSVKNQYTSKAEGYQDQLKAKETEIASLKQDLNDAKSDTKSAQQEVKKYKNGNEALADAANKYIKNDKTGAAEALLQIDTKILNNKQSKNLYQSIKDATFTTAAKQFYNNGLNQWYQKNYTEAIKYFKQAIKADDTKSDYYYYLARSYEADGKTKSAATNYDKVVKLGSTHVSDAQKRLDQLNNTKGSTAKKSTSQKSTSTSTTASKSTSTAAKNN